MSTRVSFLVPIAAVALAACVDRGGWQPAPQLAPQALTADRTLAQAQADARAWPADAWWRSYGDPQLDALVDEALAGSPSLQVAEARLRAAQGQSIAARAALAPTGTVDGSVTRQRFPVHGLFPPPFGGSSWTQAQT